MVNAALAFAAPPFKGYAVPDFGFFGIPLAPSGRDVGAAELA